VPIIELSQTIEANMVTYPGLPGPIICDFMSRKRSREVYAPGYEFQIGSIEMVGNTGTYLDTPFHRFADGEDLAAVDIARVAELDAIRVDATGMTAIGVDAFANIAVEGRAVLVHTGWDVHWRTEAYLTGNPFLTAAAAFHLADQGAALVGIDSLNIDDTSTFERPVHTILLGAGIPIVEHLTGLGQLPATGFRFTAAPPKVVGMGTFPVRAYAVTPS
jgi:kynurenine formamidase